VVKWGYDGHIPLIYFVLLAVKMTHAESLEACTSVYHGAHKCTLGTHGSEGVCMPAPPGGRARLRPLGIGRGSMLGGGILYPLFFCFFTFLGLNWALGWLYSPIESKN
jgi:hypothetical protein